MDQLCQGVDNYAPIPFRGRHPDESVSILGAEFTRTLDLTITWKGGGSSAD